MPLDRSEMSEKHLRDIQRTLIQCYYLNTLYMRRVFCHIHLKKIYHTYLARPFFRHNIQKLSADDLVLFFVEINEIERL